MRFNIRSILIAVAVVAVAVAAIERFVPRPTQVTLILDAKHWARETAGKQRVMFVDADFNAYTSRYADRFDSFCRSIRSQHGDNAILIDTTEGTGEPWDIAQDIWQANELASGGYKGFGGAGRIVWLDDGKLVDYDYLAELTTIEEFNSRTENAFSHH